MSELPSALLNRPFTADEAALAGLSVRMLRRLVAAGEVRQPLRSVFLSARLPDDLNTRAETVAKVLPAGSAVCRSSAAWLYGVDARRIGDQATPVPLECVVPKSNVPLRRPGVVCYCAAIEPLDIQDVGGLPVTTALRTACDLLRWRPPPVALAAADTLARRGLVTADDLAEELRRWPGHRGVAVARYLAGIVDPLSESDGESWTRLRFADAGFPRPHLQIPVGGTAFRPRFRLDLGWPAKMLAVEYDGVDWHSALKDVLHDEWRRRVLLEEYGWTVLVVGKGDVLGRSMLDLHDHRGVGAR